MFPHVIKNICDNIGAVVVVIVWWLDLQLSMQSLWIVNSNSAHGKVYSTQHCVIKFASDLRQVGVFLLALRFFPPIKLTATI